MLWPVSCLLSFVPGLLGLSCFRVCGGSLLGSVVAQALNCDSICDSICVHSLCLHVWACDAESSALQNELRKVPHAIQMHCELLKQRRSDPGDRKLRCLEIAPLQCFLHASSRSSCHSSDVPFLTSTRTLWHLAEHSCLKGMGPSHLRRRSAKSTKVRMKSISHHQHTS